MNNIIVSGNIMLITAFSHFLRGLCIVMGDMATVLRLALPHLQLCVVDAPCHPLAMGEPFSAPKNCVRLLFSKRNMGGWIVTHLSEKFGS